MSITYEKYIKVLKKEQEELNNSLSKIEIGKNYLSMLFKLILFLKKIKSFIKEIEKIDKKYCANCKEQAKNECNLKEEFLTAIDEQINILEDLQDDIEKFYPFLKKHYRAAISELKEKYVEFDIATDKEVLNISQKLHDKLNASLCA